MLDPEPAVVQGLIDPFPLQGQLRATGLLRRHQDRHLRQRECEEAQILQESAPAREGIRGRVGHALVMDMATIGVAQKEEHEQGIDQQDIFYRVGLFLAAINLLYLLF